MTIIEEYKAHLQVELGDIRIGENETFSFGQREIEAALYIEVGTIDDLVAVITAARKHGVPFSLLGNGFTPTEDSRSDALVIKNNCRKFGILSMRGKISGNESDHEYSFVSAESGVGLNQLVRFTIEEGLGGLESFLGESGTVGDGLSRNVYYAKGNEYLSEHIFTVRFLTKENEVVEVNAEPLLHPFTVNMIEKKQIIPLSVVFAVLPSDKQVLWKKGTQAAFERNQTELMDPLKGNFSR